MAAEETRVQVEICGETYTLRAALPREHLVTVAGYVDRTIRDIMQRNPRLNLAKAAVLAALNIADELQRLQESYDGLVKIIEGERLK
ncbi:MAG: cell division protein ZapA [Bacillota bacterium]